MVYVNLATVISQLTIQTQFFQAYRLLGLVLRLANFEANEIALGISGTAVVLSIAIPETVSLSSFQFQVSHNTNRNTSCVTW